MTRSQLLQDNLFLNRFYCNMFKDKGKNFTSLEDFRKLINQNDENTDLDFFNALIDDERLRAKIKNYNENIQEYLDQINSKREIQINLKYFQYLSILFTEIHLDRYFEDKDKLRNDIIEFCYELEDAPTDFDDKNLRKIAIWSATGSGKTLLMHINYLQVLRYLKEHDKLEEVDNLFLITPNEGLTNQHKQEFLESGIESEELNPSAFSHNSLSKWSNNKLKIKILDNHKIIKESELGEKTRTSKNGGKSVDVEALGKNNVVFVDEGHKGNKSIGSVWKENRNRLFEYNGFMFEYSATFAESIGKKNDDGFDEYSKSIIFDYRYKFFHADGYGKDYSILNLSKETEENLNEYLTGALLSFFEQKKLYNKDNILKKSFNLESPLMLFVGAKVMGDKSDIANAISFIVSFVNEEKIYINLIDKIMSGNSDIKNQKTGESIYNNRLLNLRDIPAKQIYEEIIRKIFHAGESKKLGLHQLDADGEIGLKFKDKWFGVINVGDVSGVLKEIEKKCQQVNIEKSSTKKSLFEEVDDNDEINFILGSKKFIEGWNCFRISAMGIMNMGKSEGAQIIQLFGRGVRLRGYNNSLKRTSALNNIPDLPKGIEEIETLKIFGLAAQYMEQFNSILEKEGLGKKDIIRKLKIKKNFPESENLYVPTLSKKEEEFFVDVPHFEVNCPEETQEIHLESIVSVVESRQEMNRVSSKISQTKIHNELLNLLDIQRIFLKLKDFCSRKNISNVFLTYEKVKELILNIDYIAFGGEDLLDLTKGNLHQKVIKIENYVLKILQKIIEEEISVKTKEWEKENFTYEKITKNDKRLLDNEEYTFEIDSSIGPTIVERLDEIEKEIHSWEGDKLIEKERFLEFLFLPSHLFYPLVYLEEDKDGRNKELVKIVPTPLVKSEEIFLTGFVNYVEANKEKIPFKKMYLLRNMPKIGTGFSLRSGRFYPDFILWCVEKDKQYISFIDPKGISRMSAESEKIKLYEDIKKIEKKLKGKDGKEILLNSFIVTNTKFDQIKDNFNVKSKDDLKNMNLLFLDDESFVKDMFEKIVKN
ncbi:hypothetical protein COY27_06815 [Candidatus Woesearchaeota archaeon CG_4_10_14_0_2_um_filter_33_13]|nr:MAG: hypothetical protein COY27_06815 [Candidatus Woesearchaeota archaeon CG_4_10_14_0_2_um_filter_33_13]